MESSMLGLLSSLAIVFTAPVSSAQSAPVLTSPPQTDMPGINVTAPYTSTHGGYVISGDFKVDSRMPTVVFPGQALVKDDVLSVQPVHLNDDEYLVLQECASADCRQAHLVRVWSAGGAQGLILGNDARVHIKHENKYFIWMQRLPESQMAVCAGCETGFTSFQSYSPPMVLVPTGTLAAYEHQSLDASSLAPVPVAKQAHEGSTFVVTFEGGAVVRIRRMHSAR